MIQDKNPFDKFSFQYRWERNHIMHIFGPPRTIKFNPYFEEMKDRVNNLPNDEKIRLAIDNMFGQDLILTLEDALEALSNMGFKTYDPDKHELVDVTRLRFERGHPYYAN